ncbi:MAG TPA: hypothetical protein PK359_23845, partial [Burkholderiaceae bacterium]|nr:hypothetical protein [Burkholderiaceae bacterium]
NAIGDDRHSVFGAQADDAGHLVAAGGHDHTVGQLGFVDRFIAAMLQAGRCATGKAHAEALGEGAAE